MYVKPQDYPYKYNPNTDWTVWNKNLAQSPVSRQHGDQYKRSYAQMGEPAELGGAKKEAKSEGSFNEFDGTFHHSNGARYFPNGNKVDGVNGWLAQERLAQEEPAKVAEPAKGGAASPDKDLNPFDGTKHADGKRYFPDGKEVSGANLHLANRLAQEPAELGGAGGAAAPSKPLNQFDGTVHEDGKRFFPDGKRVDGVNLWLN
jgi:hypothetical protein